MTMANEREQMQKDITALELIFQRQAPNDFDWFFERFKNESHSSTHHLSTYNGLKRLFDSWRITDPQKLLNEKGIIGINQHYLGLSERFGYDIKPQEWQINALGYYLLEQNELKQALIIFLQNIDNYPESINAYDSLADAYLNLNKTKLAKKSYVKACKLAKNINMMASSGFVIEWWKFQKTF